jgi:Sulfotransferase family
MTAREPSFLIVGTSRSGTTLVQRLAWGLQGVRVPPETHFFGRYVRLLLEQERFPMDEEALRGALKRFGRMRTSRGLSLEADCVVEDLHGSCASPWDLFGAIVRQMAGPADVYGEKTPEHLRCWEALTTRAPALRVICVVREPRAVVASNLDVPFAPKSVAWLAERWRMDQGQVADACAGLGSTRCLVLRYEDVVADPDAATADMAGFLGVAVAEPEPDGVSADGDTAPTTAPRTHMEWEWWKDRTSAPITGDRIDAWRERITPAQAQRVLAICRGPMTRFGYDDGPGRVEAAARQAVIAPAEQWRRVHLRAKVHRYRSYMAKAAL